MNFDLKKSAAEKLLLVAHRGAFAGNIPCNTIAAYENALAEGADMIEIDVDMTEDGKLVIFHPGMERALLGFSERISRLPWSFVKNLRYVNTDDCPTQFGICTLDEVLERFKDRCYINVDKFWAHPREISAAIRDHGMTEQVLVKTSVKPQYLDIVEEWCADMPYMAIADETAQLQALAGRKLRYMGVEAIFKHDDDPLVSPASMAALHEKGLLLWCNAIVYNYRTVIAGDRTDDRAVLGDPEGSWGWIADRGFDLMQTDHTLKAALFLEKTGRRPRSALC